MTTYGLRSLSGNTQATDVDGIKRWCWSDHDGMHLSDDLPTRVVPTGFIWGWGPGVWVRWRTDPFAPTVGAELREGTSVGLVGACVELHAPGIPEGWSSTVPSTVVEPRFLRMVSGSPTAADVRDTGLTVLRVLSPVQLAFFALGPEL